jgi:hypothetical protein
MNQTIDHPARSRTRPRALSTGLLAVGLGFGLVACGGGDEKTTDTTAAPAAGATTAAPASSSGGSGKKACDVVSAADFKTVFGVDAKESKELPGGVAVCTHNAVIIEPSVQVFIVTVRFSPNGAGTFDGEQGGVEKALGAKGTSISGIGDKAIETVGSVSGQSQAWITMTKGSAVVQVSVAGVKDQAEAKTKVEALAKLAAAKL